MAAMACACPPSPWLPFLFSSSLSDVTVIVGGERYALHRFPLFVRSHFFRQKFEEYQSQNRVTLDLSWLPGGKKTFREICQFCYGETPNLTPESVGHVMLAAERLEMTEESSSNNLIKISEDYLRSKVYSSWKNCLFLLQNFRDLDTVKDSMAFPRALANCSDVIIEYASDLDNCKPFDGISDVLALFHQFERMSPFVLKELMKGLLSKKVTFVTAGNYLASEGFFWVLSEGFHCPSSLRSNSGYAESTTISPEAKSDDSDVSEITLEHLTTGNGSGNRAENRAENQVIILGALIDSLGLTDSKSKTESTPEYQISYLITLLKACRELNCDVYTHTLETCLSEKIPLFSLDDLKALEWGTVKFLLTQYKSKPEEEKPKSLANPSLEALVDKYLLFAVENWDAFELSDLLFLIDMLPHRNSCDVLYDAIDAFLLKNTNINESDRVLLCGHLNAEKLSQAKVESAVQNSRMPVQPAFFTRLYFLQKEEIEILRTELRKKEKAQTM